MPRSGHCSFVIAPDLQVHAVHGHDDQFFQVVAADIGAHLEGAQVQPGDEVTGGDEGFGRLSWAEGAGAGPGGGAVRRSASEAVNAQFRPAS
ncbi:hypothetical protein OHA72_48620 [Dactylosporangium sp. NBC_01737]|uniref:hypothetical protein n=1 Tax=Dactylosporangium sp. NBC_01737 TaxID=2975959 RepID=UPI002E12CC2C|nr:hypothetical protein OHA72_48620 [Dactylosporangium sp. NBC_01737]